MGTKEEKVMKGSGDEKLTEEVQKRAYKYLCGLG